MTETSTFLQKSALPQPQDDQLTWLHRQNRLLNKELGDKSREIDELKREKENFDKTVHVNRIQPTRLVFKVVNGLIIIKLLTKFQIFGGKHEKFSVNQLTIFFEEFFLNQVLIEVFFFERILY